MSNKLGVFTIPTGFTGSLSVLDLGFPAASVIARGAAASVTAHYCLGVASGPTGDGKTRCHEHRVSGGDSKVVATHFFLSFPGLRVDFSGSVADGFVLNVVTNTVGSDVEVLYYAFS